jgi:tRNA (guanine26-N2/guanine27-N2)-dimethyltransferase
VLSFSEGRTFRTAVRLRRHAAGCELAQLGLLAHCHGCGDQQVQSLLQLRQWQPCLCGPSPPPSQSQPPLAISGPLWIGPLQHQPTLARLQALSDGGNPVLAVALAPDSRRLLGRLLADPGDLPRCWPTSGIGRQLGGGAPPLQALVAQLQQRGYRAGISGVMPGQLRSDAPWSEILQSAGKVAAGGGRAAK